MIGTDPWIRIHIKTLRLPPWMSLTKIAGSGFGSIIQRYGSPSVPIRHSFGNTSFNHGFPVRTVHTDDEHGGEGGGSLTWFHWSLGRAPWGGGGGPSGRGQSAWRQQTWADSHPGSTPTHVKWGKKNACRRKRYIAVLRIRDPVPF
jgi:hypothetical protein